MEERIKRAAFSNGSIRCAVAEATPLAVIEVIMVGSAEQLSSRANKSVLPGYHTRILRIALLMREQPFSQTT